jgi:hypothetical protein
MPLTLFVFRSDGAPAFELWAPRELQRHEAPQALGVLVAERAEGFSPNLFVGHDQGGEDLTLPALVARLQEEAATRPGAEVLPARSLAGPSGEIRIVSFTHDGPPASGGRLYQMTACLLAPETVPGRRDLVFLTGSCSLDQRSAWDAVFVEAARSVRFEPDPGRPPTA